MAELNVTIRYRTPQAKFLFSFMCLLIPLWALASPITLVGYVFMICQNRNEDSALTVLSTFAALFIFTIASLLVTIMAEDNRIHVSKDGIVFPLFLLSRLSFRRHRSWAELTGASIVERTRKGKAMQDLVLGFSQGSILPLHLNLISSSNQEQLLMAIELWANNCQRSDSLLLYQKQIQNQGRASGSVGYTQMWEEELSRRFVSTAFIPLEPGKKLQNGDLEVVRQLAFGGLSALYIAQKKGLDLVVLKEAVVPANANQEMRANAEGHLAREATVLANLRHPRIARVFDHFIEDGRHYLVLEYVRGQDLRQFIGQNGPLKESLAIDWAISIAETMAFLHEQTPPVIHRDITPDNMVLSNSGDIIIIDFGAANLFVGTATGTIVGKQAYIPPEQLRGKTVTQSDIYAFGGSLYFLLTGKDPKALAVSHPKLIRPDLNDDLDKIIAKCLAFEVKNRFENANEIVDSLKALKKTTV